MLEVGLMELVFKITINIILAFIVYKLLLFQAEMVEYNKKINSNLLINFKYPYKNLYENFDKYKYFFLLGGRVAGKSQSAMRTLLHFAMTRKIKIACLSFGAHFYPCYRSLAESILGEYPAIPLDLTRDNCTSKFTKSTVRFKIHIDNLKEIKTYDVIFCDDAECLGSEQILKLKKFAENNSIKLIFIVGDVFEDTLIYKGFCNEPGCLCMKSNFTHNQFLETRIIDIVRTEKQTMSGSDYSRIWLGESYERSDKNEKI